MAERRSEEHPDNVACLDVEHAARSSRLVRAAAAGEEQGQHVDAGVAGIDRRHGRVRLELAGCDRPSEREAMADLHVSRLRHVDSIDRDARVHRRRGRVRLWVCLVVDVSEPLLGLHPQAVADSVGPAPIFALTMVPPSPVGHAVEQRAKVWRGRIALGRIESRHDRIQSCRAEAREPSIDTVNEFCVCLIEKLVVHRHNLAPGGEKSKGILLSTG